MQAKRESERERDREGVERQGHGERERRFTKETFEKKV